VTPAQRKLKALYASIGLDTHGLFDEARKPSKSKQKAEPRPKRAERRRRRPKGIRGARATFGVVDEGREYFVPPRAPEPPLEPVFAPARTPPPPPLKLRDGEQLDSYLETRKPHVPAEPAKLDRATELAAGIAHEKAAAAAAAEAQRAEVDAKAKWKGTCKASGAGRKCKLPAHGDDVEHRDERGTFRLAGPAANRELDIAAWRTTG
jgi:hypothetical protein